MTYRALKLQSTHDIAPQIVHRSTLHCIKGGSKLKYHNFFKPTTLLKL